MTERRSVVDRDGVHAEVVDGTLVVLRFRHPSEATPRDTLGRIAAVIDAAMAQDAAERPQPQPDRNPDRDRVMAVVDRELERARRFGTPRRPAWRVGRADGRDASGRVHVSVDCDKVALVDVGPDLLADPRAAAAGIVEAFNLARARLADDGRAIADLFGNDVDSFDDTSWTQLRRDLDEFSSGA